jgi:hypothetical protein
MKELYSGRKEEKEVLRQKGGKLRKEEWPKKGKLARDEKDRSVRKKKEK